MSNEVYANGNAVACKSGDGKVIAAFPDVCLSPPSPPAGPIPIPYPDTSFSKDMMNGSKTVRIDGKEVMLKDKSYYKTSPLGDEAATRSFGGNVVTHTITGKTYFIAWSMDVKFEGQNVDRHTDLTTSNHNPPPGGTPPNPDLESATWAELEDETKKCACCGSDQHSDGKRVTMEEWYTQDNHGNTVTEFQTGFTTSKGKAVKGFPALMKDVENRKSLGPPDYPGPCTCNGKVLPEPPCNVFRQNTTKDQRDKIKDDWDDCSEAYRAHQNPPLPTGSKVNHLVPKAAGGCATGDGNLQSDVLLCATCQNLDGRFTDLQGSHLRTM